mmetsp:Transcript_37215/g.105011  ORF Transcript_37215/g.105011 Transcript_37215/m.105011 type:complete len:405 (+) Transcript_37215:341-1555(+)
MAEPPKDAQTQPRHGAEATNITDGVSLSRTSSINRYKYDSDRNVGLAASCHMHSMLIHLGMFTRTPTTSGESLSSSVDEDNLPPFLHLPAAESQGKHKDSDARNRIMLSQSITELHNLVSAKIEDVLSRKEAAASKIPAAPHRVRPISARSIAATRIPRAKGSEDAASVFRPSPERRKTLQVQAAKADKPKNKVPSNPVIAEQNWTRGGTNTSENSYSPASSSTPVGMRDSTEVGLNRLREDFVAGSIALDGQVDEFKKTHRTMANGELNQTSTDQLLSTFVRGSIQREGHLAYDDGEEVFLEAAALQDEFTELYSEDDFEDLEDVEEEAMGCVQESIAPTDISAQAQALYGSLHQLRALMASPQMSRRATLTTEASIPEDLEQTLSAIHLTQACSALEDVLKF